jgi:hypothetical protein
MTFLFFLYIICQTDYKANTVIAKELNITSVLDEIQHYRTNWMQHTDRLSHNRFPKILKNYRPTGRRNQGIPLTGQQAAQLRDSYIIIIIIIYHHHHH